MTVQKIQSGRVITHTSENFVGSLGTLFYNEDQGDLRLGDGVTPGGRLLNLGGGTGNSYPSFGTIRIANQLDLTAVGNDILEFVAGSGMRITNNTLHKTITFESTMLNVTLDGGVPNSVYGGLTVVDGGGI
jgi:hypothetical protein